MMKATVPEVAELFEVTEKTVREWIREGCPTVRAGGKGPGCGAIVDMARFGAWYSKREKRPLQPTAQFFETHYPGRNPLRDIVDCYTRGAIYFLGVAFRDWAKEPASQGLLDFRTSGLTSAQAQEIAFKVWVVAALLLAAYREQTFEKLLDRDLDGDLDAWLSLLTTGAFSTSWKQFKFEVPTQIRELAPPDLIAHLEKRKNRKTRKRSRARRE